MAIELPPPIAAYFTADLSDAQAVARCFAKDALVTDEGQDHRGRAAIAAWKAAASKKYSYTATPIAIEERDGRTVVTAHLIGDFPGSPVDLRYFFTLEDGLISTLRIIL